MKQGWANNGQPLDDGRLCYVIDLEDGSRPIKTYGRTVKEVLEKVARTAGHAELTVMRDPRRLDGREPAQPAGSSAAPRPVPAPARKPLTPDEQLKTTADLSVASKAPSAVVKLFEAETGIDVTRLQATQFSEVAMNWRRDHPDFFDHPANVELLTTRAIRKAGGLRFTGYEHLEDAYRELQAEGKLIREIESAPVIANRTAPATLPEETPAPGVARPRGGTFATSFRGTKISGQGSGSPRPRLKYTREQIDNMPLVEMRRLIESGDPEYAAAVEFYSQPRMATA